MVNLDVTAASSAHNHAAVTMMRAGSMMEETGHDGHASKYAVVTLAHSGE